MIINRFAQSLKRRDWGLVIIELALVFAGVFIALQFDNWNTHRRNQAALTEMLERVSAELDLNDEVIDDLRARVDLRREARDVARQALQTCDDRPDARAAINQTLADLTGDFSPSLSNETLPQLNRRDPYLDLLSSEFRWALAVYSNHVQEEQRQLQFNAGLRWDQHVIKHRFVAADFDEESTGLLLDPNLAMTDICADASFGRQFFITTIFLDSTVLRLERFSDRMNTFREILEAEIASRS
jgi:hypothetical protein